MKRSEAINKYWDAISAEMIDCYRRVLESHGRVKYSIYIWDDGEIRTLEAVTGETSWYEPREGCDRELIYITTVEYPNFDPWDAIGEPAPEDEDQREQAEDQVIDSMAASYAEGLDDLMCDLLDDATREECEADGREVW